MGRFVDMARASNVRLRRVDLKELSNFSNNEQTREREETDSTTKETNLTKEQIEFEASMRQLEAMHVSVAVWEDGSMRIVSDDTASEARRDGATIYTPKDALYFIRLSESERRLLHSFKKKYGRTDWRNDASL